MAGKCGVGNSGAVGAGTSGRIDTPQPVLPGAADATGVNRAGVVEKAMPSKVVPGRVDCGYE